MALMSDYRRERELRRRLDRIELLLWISVVLNLACLGCLGAWEYRFHRLRNAWQSSAAELGEIGRELNELKWK